jgi:hypothetical protein
VKGAIDTGVFLLPPCIEVAQVHGHGPTPEGVAATAHFEALRKRHDCPFVHFDGEWYGEMSPSRNAALAASKGQTELTLALIKLDDDIIRRINAGNWRRPNSLVMNSARNRTLREQIVRIRPCQFGLNPTVILVANSISDHAADCRAAKREQRVLAGGLAVCQSAILTRLTAAAVMTCCK